MQLYEVRLQAGPYLEGGRQYHDSKGEEGRNSQGSSV